MTTETPELSEASLKGLVVEECSVSEDCVVGLALGPVLGTCSFSRASLGPGLQRTLTASWWAEIWNEVGVRADMWAFHRFPSPAGADIQVASWLDGASSVKLSSLALNTAVVGEPVEVLVSVSNPLGLELSISRMKLSFETEPASQSDAEEAPDASAAPGEAPGSALEDAPEPAAKASTPPSILRIVHNTGVARTPLRASLLRWCLPS